MFGTIDVKSKIKDYSILFINDIDEINELINKKNSITVIDKTVKQLFFNNFRSISKNIKNLF
jgi:uncharacterized protein YlbG (UPF0298 family)